MKKKKKKKKSENQALSRQGGEIIIQTSESGKRFAMNNVRKQKQSRNLEPVFFLTVRPVALS